MSKVICILQVILFSLFIGHSIINGKWREKLLKVPRSQSKNCRNKSIFAKNFDFFFSNSEITRINLILSVNSYQSYQSWKFSFIVENSLKSIFNFIIIKHNLLMLLCFLSKQFSNYLLINLSTFLRLTFLQQIFDSVCDVLVKFT